jgi:hypothetical protein
MEPPDPSAEIPDRSRVQTMIEIAVILGVSLVGLIDWKSWWTVPAAAVVLLFVSDRGQHRWLADRFPALDQRHVLALSIGAHLLNNTFFMILAFVAGAATRWLWGL